MVLPWRPTPSLGDPSCLPDSLSSQGPGEGGVGGGGGRDGGGEVKEEGKEKRRD